MAHSFECTFSPLAEGFQWDSNESKGYTFDRKAAEEKAKAKRDETAGNLRKLGKKVRSFDKKDEAFDFGGRTHALLPNGTEPPKVHVICNTYHLTAD